MSNLQKIFLSLDQAELDLKNYTPQSPSTGKIISVKDSVALITGLNSVSLGEIVVIEEIDARGLVLQIDSTTTSAVILEKTLLVKPGQIVSGTKKQLEIPTGESMLGRVVNPLGQPLDNGTLVQNKHTRPLEIIAPGVITRKSVHQPLMTGIVAIDCLIPIGLGQRELIIGDRQTGKTTLAIDTILNQKNTGVKCVYVAIGQRNSKLSQVIDTLTTNGAMQYTCIVSASASDPASLQYLAPYAGQSIAEHFMHQGDHVLIIFDDLSKHAVAYRELSLVLRKPPGREAYPGDVFYLHSKLLERAAKLNDELGGGSVTALPIIETQAGDVSAYIPTNVISITDGQIFLETALFYKGIRPAINVGLSVSRVGGAAQTNLIKKISGSAKLMLAQYYELAAFSQFASELDEDSKKQLTRGERLVEILKQKPHQPIPQWEQALMMYQAINGYLDHIDKGSVRQVAADLCKSFKISHPKQVKQMETDAKMTDELNSELKKFFDSQKN